MLASDATRAPGIRRREWVPWVVAAAVVVIAFVWLDWRAQRQWSRAIARLESEPGIVVVRAERGGSRWRLSGLRDPLASQPLALLTAVGVDSATIIGRWQSYVSLDPLIVLRRARLQLDAPATVALALAGDTLRARGFAPLDWVAHVAALQAFPPGVEHVDIGVEPRLPGEVAAVGVAVGEGRVLFDVGSAELRADARATIAKQVTAVRRIDGAIAPLGGRAWIELVGRADPTGSDSTNRLLSRQRSDAVLAALAAHGLDASRLQVRALGTSAPLAGPDAAARAALNRSVTLGIRLTRDAPTRAQPR